MKHIKLFSLIAIICATLCCSCTTNEPTELNENTVKTTTVCGHVTYIYSTKSKANIIENAPEGTEVLITTYTFLNEYTNSTTQVVKVDDSGFYTATVPVGYGSDASRCGVSVKFVADDYIKELYGTDFVTTECVFTGGDGNYIYINDKRVLDILAENNGPVGSEAFDL